MDHLFASGGRSDPDVPRVPVAVEYEHINEWTPAHHLSTVAYSLLTPYHDRTSILWSFPCATYRTKEDRSRSFLGKEHHYHEFINPKKAEL
jgi:hypothetical protein